MPHLTLEISTHLAIEETAALKALNQTLVQSGVFAESSEIKSRLYRPAASLVGVATDAQGFACMKLALMAGRSDEVKAQLASSLLQTLQNILKPQNSEPIQYSIEIVELATYQKVVA